MKTDEQLKMICSKANPIDFAIEWEKFWTDQQEGETHHEPASGIHSN